jgi:biopolymer transport protein ExbB/TolQ
VTTLTDVPLAAGLINDALSGIARALEVPVHVAALLLLLVLGVELGRAVTEIWRRHRPGRLRLPELSRTIVHDPRRTAELAPQAPTPIAANALEAIGAAIGAGQREWIEHALTEYEIAVGRRLDRTRLLVRFGPALGLAGTLIPLAPGLGALGRGDIAGLAEDLQVAFAATVIGLLVGTVAFGLTLTRTRLYAEDLAAIEHAVALLPPDRGPTSPAAVSPATGVGVPSGSAS